MAEFCTCGSIIIGSHCTNKNCNVKVASKSTNEKPKKESATKKEAKPSRTRRASKCITYNMYELDKKAEENAE